MDRLSLLGVVLGAAAILSGQHLEGGELSALLNGPAILIVLGGTVGAVMVQSPLSVFVRGVRMSSWVVVPPGQPFPDAIERIVDWSRVARKEGLLGLEPIADAEGDAFARRGLQLLVDGSEPDAIRATLHVDLGTRVRRDLAGARVIEAMGRYAPTIGLIGAAMGLIQVLGDVGDPARLRGGIAVAFVATLYGMVLANLLFLPAANKIRSVIDDQSHFREMLVEGFVAIAEGENPRSIEARLHGYLA